MTTYHYIQKVFGLLFLMTGSVWGQDLTMNPASPTVSGLSQFESSPTDLSTGIPNISIPLYKMPTLSKDISIPLSISYHPSSVAAIDSLTGNCGRGWTLNDGGIIYRKMERRLANDTIANQQGLYYFNFRQFNGKFAIKNDTINGWEAEVSANNGTSLVVKVNYDNLTDWIDSFTIFDDQGYSYIFREYDQYTYSNKVFDPNYSPPEYKIPHKSAFHLEKIIDPNGVQLVDYEYETYHPDENYLDPPGENTGIQKQLTGITISGYGSIALNKQDNTDSFLHYSEVIVKDINDHVVKRFEFKYDENLLEQVDEGDDAMANVLSYKLSYRKNVPFPSSQVIDIDAWGFYSLVDKSALYTSSRTYTRTASETMAMRNVLQKMELPTGGCIIYDYELNTYSTLNGQAMGMVVNPITLEREESPNLFTTLSTENSDNFNFIGFDSHEFNAGNSSSWTFNVSGGPKTLCFYLEAEPSEAILSEDNPELFYPLGTIESVGTFGGLKNAHNKSYGIAYTLGNGSYTIALTSVATTTPYGKVHITEAIPVSNPVQGHKGNGIRIKNTAYFTDGSTPQNYFNNPGAYVPDRVVNYNYNFKDRPYRSSGSLEDERITREIDGSNALIYNTPSKEIKPIRYANVTITDSNVPGKVVYDFVSPIDSPREDESFDIFSFGKPKVVTAYNTANDTIRSTSYTYTKHTLFTVGPRMEVPDTGTNEGWMETSSMKDKTYYPGGNVIEKQYTYDYGNNRRIAVETETTSVSNDSLVSKFFYHNPFNAYLNNRVGKIERIEKYRNSELLSTSKINYQKDWDAIDEGEVLGVPNEAWLVASDSISKGDRDARARIKYNKYDAYSHPLEVQQENGLKTVFLWGYHHTQIVAKLENIDYDSVPKLLIDDIRDASDTGTETDLINAFNALRSSSALSTARITTYTYIPLVGLHTMTDINGLTTTYEYDVLGRLISVKDNDGKLLSENEYNYRTQN